MEIKFSKTFTHVLFFKNKLSVELNCYELHCKSFFYNNCPHLNFYADQDGFLR